MLFQTVYGVELDSIYQFIQDMAKDEIPIPVRYVYDMFIEKCADGEQAGRQSIDDALRVLHSAYLIDLNDDQITLCPTAPQPFCLQLLLKIRALELGTLPARQPIDRLYGLLLTELFIKPNVLFIADVHAAANRLEAVQAFGGLSREKILAWKRVMEFLGVGRRAFNGFQCVYHPPMLLDILAQWQGSDTTLHHFLTRQLAACLPFATHDGELANAVLIPLLHLQAQRMVVLSSLQDSPSPSYGGSAYYRAIHKVQP